MRVLPILFNTEMVQAILDGKKTCTRRIMKPANPFRGHEYKQKDGLWVDGYGDASKKEADGHIKDYSIGCCWIGTDSYIEKYAPYHTDDILYVRESVFEGYGHYLDVSGEMVSFSTHDFEYYADGLHTKSHWKDKSQRIWMNRRPSIHMPKEAARIWLKVTDVRIEQLQDISIENAIKEGIYPSRCGECNATFGCDTCPDEGYYEIDAFAELWNSTIKKSDIATYGWNASPYVWVIEFEQCEKPKESDRMSEKLIMLLNRNIDTLKKLEEMYMEKARPRRRFMEVRNALRNAIIVLTEKKERYDKSEKEPQVVRTPDEIANMMDFLCDVEGDCSTANCPFANNYETHRVDCKEQFIDWLTKRGETDDKSRSN